MNTINKNWFLRHKFMSVLILFSVIIALLISTKSLIATYYLRDFFKQHASDIAIADLSIDIFESEFTIDGLATRHANGQQLNIDSLYVYWQFGGLFDNHIAVNTFEIDGLTLDIQSNEFVPVQIGPLLLSKFQSSEQATDEPAESAEPWSVEVNNIKLTNLKICLDDLSLIYEELGMPLTDNQQQLGVCLTTDAIVLDGDVVFDKTQQLGYDGILNLENLALTTTNDESLLQLASLNMNSVTFDSEQISVVDILLESLAILAQSKEATHTKFGLGLKSLSAENLLLKLDASQIGLNLLNVNDLIVRAKAADQAVRPMTEISEINVIDFSQIGDDLTVASISFANSQFFENFTNPDEQQPYLASLAQLSISEIAVKPGALEITGIKLNDLESLVSIDDKGANLANWIATSEKSSEEEPIESGTVEANPAESMQVSIQDISLQPANIRILESLTETQYEHQLRDISLTIQNISTDITEGATPSTISYEIGLGENGSLTGEGTFMAKPGNPEVAITGKLNTVNLVDVSHLATRFIGYRIDRGLLNVDYTVAIKDQQIDAEVKSLLEKFALAELEQDEKSPLNEDLGLPLPLALNLLRDSDDNIELDLPITGDINSPDFSVSSIVSTVMVTAIKNAVILNYSPLGMLTMASGILDLATALKFDPVVFEPRNTELSTKANEQLDKIITLMQEKPKVKMVICGVATELDAPKQTPVAITGEQTNLDGETTPVIEPMVDPMQLIQMAQQRQDIVVNYIINNGSIDKSRLIGCNVKVAKKKDAKPKVEISI